MEVSFKPSFIRELNDLPKPLLEEARQKIKLFKDLKNHASLHVHKLKGRMEGQYSFSVNYRYRIVFMWEVKHKSAICLTIGDHAIYE